LSKQDTAAYTFTYKGARWVVVYCRLDNPVENHRWSVTVWRDGLHRNQLLVAPKQSLNRAKKLVATLE